MAKTVMVTGTSSGIGEAAALLFSRKGWNVVATMLDPEAGDSPLRGKDNVDIVRLDLLDAGSIVKSIDFAYEKYGRLDVLVNNAGYGVLGIFEASTQEQVEKLFHTNALGPMNVIRAILPRFRAQGGGTIVTVASVQGRLGLPMYSMYCGTKWALEGFLEALQYELFHLGIRIKIIEPGVIRSGFHDAAVLTDHMPLKAYDDVIENILRNNQAFVDRASPPEGVAGTIYRAAVSHTWKLRYPAGSNARLMLYLKRILPFRLFQLLFKAVLLH